MTTLIDTLSVLEVYCLILLTSTLLFVVFVGGVKDMLHTIRQGRYTSPVMHLCPKGLHI